MINQQNISQINPSMIQMENKNSLVSNQSGNQNGNQIVIVPKFKASHKTHLHKLEKDITKLAFCEELISNKKGRTLYSQNSVIYDFLNINQNKSFMERKMLMNKDDSIKQYQIDDEFNENNNPIFNSVIIQNTSIQKNEEIKLNPAEQIKNRQAHITTNFYPISDQKNNIQKSMIPDSINQTKNMKIISPSNPDEHLSPKKIGRRFNVNPDNNFNTVKKLFLYQLQMSLFQVKKLCISVDLHKDNNNENNLQRKPSYYNLISNYSGILTSNIYKEKKYDDLNIEINDYFIFKNSKLGEGGYSTVYSCQNLKDKKQYAVKITDKKSIMNKHKRKYDYVKEEVTILKRLHSKYVVQVYEILENNTHVYIIMEFCPNKSLFDKINKLEHFQVWSYFRNMICSVEHCHEIAKIVHRDINVNNLLLSSDDLLMLSDFGISYIIEDDNDLIPCNLPSTYTPPEKIFGNSQYYHGKPADMWLIGVTLYHMVCQEPFMKKSANFTKEEYMNIQIVIPKIAKEREKQTEEAFDSKLDYVLDNRVEKLILDLMYFDPAKRPTFADLRKNKWVTHNDEYPLPDIHQEALNYCYNISSKEVHNLLHDNNKEAK